jgi:2'-5' RNA ligase
VTDETAARHAPDLRNHWWSRPGWHPGREFYTWHLTFAGQQDLHRLVTAYQEALADIPGLDLVPIPWLHLTMQGIGFTDEVSLDDVQAIAETARDCLAELDPVHLTFQQAVARPEALALPPKVTAPVIRIRDSVRKAIAAVWGPGSLPEADNLFDPHLSIAYVNTAGPSTPAISALASVKAPPALTLAKEASLIKLRRDCRLYRWTTLQQVAIGCTPNPTT